METLREFRANTSLILFSISMFVFFLAIPLFKHDRCACRSFVYSLAKTSQSLRIVRRSVYLLTISFSISGKCLADSGRVHLAHEALLHSICVLFKSNRFSHNQPSVSQLLEFIGKEATRDVFAIDRAVILYNLCWLSLRNYHCTESRYV